MKETAKPSLQDQIYKECMAMAKYALDSGKKIPPETADIIQANASPNTLETTRNLIQIHAKLSEIIAPAMPQTILLLEEESAKRNIFGFIGPIPLIRHLMLAAFISLVLFISMQAYGPPQLLTTSINKLTKWNYIYLVLTLIGAAGIGASFAALYQANKYVVNVTYDSKYETSYWIRFVLGLIAGLSLTLLIDKEGSLGKFGKPLLAMLGGFSANLVYRILTRLIETVESLITGSKEDAISAKEQEMTAKVKIIAEDFKARQQVASGLVEIIQDPQIDTKFKEKINEQVKKLLLVDNDSLIQPKPDNGEQG